jgi:hypothetical protein
VKNVPNSTTTARRTFLLRTFGTIVISYIVLDFISSSDDPDIAASTSPALTKIPLFARLQEVTAEELVIRFCTVLAAGIGLNCVQGGIYYIIALFAVSLEVTGPEKWPPFYGSPLEAYTLRRFWKYVSISPIASFVILANKI